MVEKEDSLCARDVVQKKLLDLRVVLFFDAVVVGELLFCAVWDILDHAEAADIEVILRFVTADVVDGDLVCVFGVVALRLALWWLLDVVEGC